GNMDFRFGDFESVLENRKRFYETNDIDSDSLVVMSVEHGDQLVVVNSQVCGNGALEKRGVVGDALIVQEVSISLGLLTADCLPIVLFEPKKRVLGLIHAGWKSCEMGLVEKTLRKMIETGIDT